MEVRRLRADEGLAYREVRLRALREEPGAYGSRLIDEQALPQEHWHTLAARAADEAGGTVFVVDRGDSDLAGVTYTRLESGQPALGYIGAMWLDADLRAAGWASRLIEAAEDWLRERGAHGVHLWVSEGNERAWRFYARHGYQPTGMVEPQHFGDALELYRSL